MKILIADNSINNLTRGISICTKQIINHLSGEYKISYYHYNEEDKDYFKHYLYEQYSLENELKKHQCDFVWFTKNNGLLYSPLKRISTLYDIIALDYPELQGGIKNYYRDFLRLSRIIGATKSDIIVVPSNYTKDRLLNSFNCQESKIMVIPLACDKTIFNLEPVSLDKSKEFEQILPEKYILSVGAFNKHKNFENLIIGYIGSALQKKGIKLVIVGPQKDNTKGNMMQLLKCLVEEKKAEKDVIFLTGYNHENGIEIIYKECLFFVNTSLYEGFGLPIIEAMSCGKAVVSSGLTSQAEVIGNGGLIINPTNINNIRGGIENVFNSRSLRIELEEKAKKRSRDFSWEKTALLYQNVFDSLS